MVCPLYNHRREDQLGAVLGLHLGLGPAINVPTRAIAHAKSRQQCMAHAVKVSAVVHRHQCCHACLVSRRRQLVEARALSGLPARGLLESFALPGRLLRKQNHTVAEAAGLLVYIMKQHCVPALSSQAGQKARSSARTHMSSIIPCVQGARHPPVSPCTAQISAHRSCRNKRHQAIVLAAAAKQVASLAGDGIGPEITAVAKRVLQAAGSAAGVNFDFTDALIGGAATDACGTPLPEETLRICKESDAVLLAAIGG